MNAIAKATGLNISTKDVIEIGNFVRGKTVKRAKQILENVLDKSEPIPFKRFVHGIGHKKGKLCSGRYPINASKEILKIMKSAESNAKFKGINENLYVLSFIANRGVRTHKQGRTRGVQTKSTHIDIIVGEKVVGEKK